MYMWDTDTCIAMIRHCPASIVSRMKALKPGSIAISSIVWAELQYGVRHSPNPKNEGVKLKVFTQDLIIFPFGKKAARIYGQIREELARKGTPIGPLDTLIAAHSLSLDATLISHNVREYQRINSLKCEDWLK